MQIERCPVCGWPAPKGRPCPRGCGSPRLVSTSPAYAAPVQGPYVARPQEAAAALAAVALEAPAPETAAPPAPVVRAESRLAQRLAGPSGLGGYLLLPIIGLFVTIFLNARYLTQTLIPLYRSPAWPRLTTPGSPAYHWLWQPLILFETFGAVVMAIAPIAVLILIFRKRRAARGYAIAFYAFCCVVGAADAAAGLLVMVGWFRSLGETATADAISSDAWQIIARVLALAAIWIPYFIRSRRVKNTLINPPLPVQVDPAYFMAAGDTRPTSRRRAVIAVASIVGIIVVAGAAVFTLNSFEASSTGGSSGTPRNETGQPSKKAETAYYTEFSTLVSQNSYAEALALATETTRQFPTSRLAWFELGFAQEAQGELAAAVQSYATCLQYPQNGVPGGAPADDALVHKRLDLVTYVTAITDPRVAISDAVGQVNSALEATTPGTGSLTGAAAQMATVLSTNIERLQKITPPAYFADFHSGMLAGYGDIKSACDALATAVAGNDTASVSSAKKSLNDAVDRCNANDKLGASLLQSYYGH
jgi:hypothetical protein